MYEYCNAGDVYSLKGQLSDSDVKRLTWQLLSAMRYLHQIGLVHRDIKSSNCFLTKAQDGQPLIMKIGDFGLSRAIDNYSTTATTTANIYSSQEAPSHYDPAKHGSFERHGKHRTMVINTNRNGASQCLTGVVATPCYRAPEVVMGQGTGKYR